MAVSKSAILKNMKKLDKVNFDKDKVEENKMSRKDQSVFNTAFISKKGSREENHNYFAFVENESCACWAVADGHKDGGESAKIIVEEILASFLSNPSYSSKFLKKACKSAQKKFSELQKENSELKGKISSLAVVLSNYNSIMIAYIGNIRIYHLNNGLINFKTKDHSVAQLMFEADQMGEKDVRYHFRRNDLTRAIGFSNSKVRIEKVPMELQNGDAVLISTIGAWENMEDREIEVEFSKSHSPNDFALKLEKRVLTSGMKELNNYTIVAVCADEVAEAVSRDKLNRNYKKYMVISIVVLILLILLINLGIRSKRKNEIYSKAAAFEVQADDNLINGRYKESIEYLVKAESEYKKLANKRVSKNKFLRTVTGQQMLVETNRKQVENIQERVNKIKKLLNVDLKLEDAEKLMENNQYGEALKVYEEAAIVYKNQNFDGKDEIIGKLTDELIKDTEVIKSIAMGLDFQNEANQFFEKGDFKKALEKYTDAKMIFMKNNKAELVRKAEFKIEELNSLSGDLVESAKNYENRAYELEFKRPISSLDNFEKSLEAYTQLKRDKDAERLSAKIGELKVQISKDIVKADTYVQNALKYSNQERFDDALSTLEKAKNIYDINGAEQKVEEVAREEALVNENMKKKKSINRAFELEAAGDKKYEKKDYIGARENYVEAIAVFKANNFKTKAGKVEKFLFRLDGEMYEEQGDLYSSDRQFKTAIKAYEDSKKNYEKYEDEELVEKVALKLDESIKRDIFETGVVLETEGDKLYKNKSYEEALGKYEEAKEKYIEIRNYEAIASAYENMMSAIEKKIKKSKRKANDASWLPW